MSFDMEDLLKDSKQKWLKRMQKEDPRHARLYCNRCVKYLGAVGVCDCAQDED